MSCILVVTLHKDDGSDLVFRMTNPFARVPVTGDEIAIAVPDDKGCVIQHKKVTKVRLGTVGVSAHGTVEHVNGDVVEIELGLTDEERTRRAWSR